MRLLFSVLCLACLHSSFASAPVPKDRAEAQKIVGVWKLVKSSKGIPPGLSLEMELAAGGKMTLRQKGPDSEQTLVFTGEYKIDKNEMPYSVSAPGGFNHAETLTIKKLTDTELVVVDPDGIQEEFVRIMPLVIAPRPREKE